MKPAAPIDETLRGPRLPIVAVVLPLLAVPALFTQLRHHHTAIGAAFACLPFAAIAALTLLLSPVFWCLSLAGPFVWLLALAPATAAYALTFRSARRRATRRLRIA